MKRRSTHLVWLVLLLVAALSQLQCGDNSIVIDVDLPINQASPFAELVPQKGAILFQFDALRPNPASIDDVDTTKTSITFPDAPFAQADKESYDLSDVSLESGTLYRITMFGTITSTPPAKYKGVGDCPLRAGSGSNTIHICFGLASATPICTDTVLFAECTF